MSNLRFPRRPGQGVRIGDRVEVTVVAVHDQEADLEINAPMSVTVHRSEVASRHNQPLEETLTMHPIRMLQHALSNLARADAGMAESYAPEDIRGAYGQLASFVSVADRALCAIRESIDAEDYEPLAGSG